MIGKDYSGEQIGSSVSTAMHDKFGYVIVKNRLTIAEIDTMQYAAFFSNLNLLQADVLNPSQSLIAVVGDRHSTPEQREEQVQGAAYAVATALSIIRGGTIGLFTRPTTLDNYDIPPPADFRPKVL
jgi:hypothetical protein